MKRTLLLVVVLVAAMAHSRAQDIIVTKKHGAIQARNIRRDDGNRKLTYTITDEQGKELDVTRSYREVWNFTEVDGTDSLTYVLKGVRQWLPLPVGLLPTPPDQPHRFSFAVAYNIGFQPPYYFIEPDYSQSPSFMLGYTRYKWGDRGIGFNFSYMRLAYKPMEVGKNVNPRVIDTSGLLWVAQSQECFNLAASYSQRFYFPLRNTFFNVDLSLGLWLDQRSEHEVRWLKLDPHIRCATVAELTGQTQKKLHPTVSAMAMIAGETFFNWNQDWAITYSAGLMYPLSTVVAVGLRFSSARQNGAFNRQVSREQVRRQKNLSQQ